MECQCYAGFTGRHCQQAIRVEETTVANIELVWGLKGLKIPRTPLVEFFSALGVDGSYFTFTMGAVDYQAIDLTDEDAQRAVLDTCTAAEDDVTLRVLPGRTYCFLNLFDEWLQRERGAQLPLRNNFSELVSEYLDTSEGEALNSYVGYDCDQRVTWVVAKFVTDIDEDADNLEGPGTLLKYQRRWEAFVKERDRAAPPTAGTILQSCELWVRTQVLALIFASMRESCGVAFLFSLIALSIFTGSPRLAFMATTTVMMIVGTLGSFMVGVN